MSQIPIPRTAADSHQAALASISVFDTTVDMTALEALLKEVAPEAGIDNRKVGQRLTAKLHANPQHAPLINDAMVYFYLREEFFKVRSRTSPDTYNLDDSIDALRNAATKRMADYALQQNTLDQKAKEKAEADAATTKEQAGDAHRSPLNMAIKEAALTHYGVAHIYADDAKDQTVAAAENAITAFLAQHRASDKPIAFQILAVENSGSNEWKDWPSKAQVVEILKRREQIHAAPVVASTSAAAAPAQPVASNTAQTTFSADEKPTARAYNELMGFGERDKGKAILVGKHAFGGQDVLLGTGEFCDPMSEVYDHYAEAFRTGNADARKKIYAELWDKYQTTDTGLNGVEYRTLATVFKRAEEIEAAQKAGTLSLPRFANYDAYYAATEGKLAPAGQGAGNSATAASGNHLVADTLAGHVDDDAMMTALTSGTAISLKKEAKGHYTQNDALVKAAQREIMRVNGSLAWGADGKFGNATDAAVRTLQKQYDITVNGEINNDTVAALQVAELKKLTEAFAGAGKELTDEQKKEIADELKDVQELQAKNIALPDKAKSELVAVVASLDGKVTQAKDSALFAMVQSVKQKATGTQV